MNHTSNVSAHFPCLLAQSKDSQELSQVADYHYPDTSSNKFPVAGECFPVGAARQEFMVCYFLVNRCRGIGAVSARSQNLGQSNFMIVGALIQSEGKAFLVEHR